MDTRAIASKYRLTQWVEAMKEKTANGETIDEFCHRTGVSRNTYFYWQQKLRKTACEKIVEMQVEQPTGLTVPNFTEVKIEESPVLPETNPTSQIRVEIGKCKITADSNYPMKTLLSILREIKKPC